MEVKIMDIYKEAYHALFNQVTDTIKTLERQYMSLEFLQGGIKIECEKLKLAHAAVEEFIIENDESFEENSEDDENSEIDELLKV